MHGQMRSLKMDGAERAVLEWLECDGADLHFQGLDPAFPLMRKA